MDYTTYNKAKGELVELAKEQLEIVRFSKHDELRESSLMPDERLQNAITSLTSDRLHALVMGRFNAGKSVFLNALMGKDLLPSDVRPCTASIGELFHGKCWGATLYARDAKKQPIKIDVSQLKSFIVIPHGSKDTQENPYARVEIEAPLELFEKGVSFVDSPGLDDPTSHDEITKTYLPKADAIVYVMNCASAYSKSDKLIIDELRALGHTSIVFVLTFFDLLEMNDMMYGTNDAETCRKHCLKILSNLTDLGESGIFFVNSRGALMGKMQQNSDIIQRSHFPVVEQRLEQILADERGRMKLNKIYVDVASINRAYLQSLRNMITLSQSKLGDLREKVERAKTPLRGAERRASQIKKVIQETSETLKKEVRAMGLLFYRDMAENSIANWITNEDEISCETTLSLSKDSIEEYIKELLDGLKWKMQRGVKDWTDRELAPKVATYAEHLSLLIESEVKGCMKDIQAVNIAMDVPTDDLVNSVTPGAANRAVSAGLAILMGDIGGAVMGGVGGFSMMLKTIVCEVVAGFTLGLIGLLNPVTIIPALIGAMFLGRRWALSGLGGKIRKKLAKKVEEEFSSISKQEEFGDKLVDALDVILAEINNAMEELLIVPIKSAQNLLKEAERNLETNGASLQKQASQLSSSLTKSEELLQKLKSFENKYLGCQKRLN